MSERSLTIPFTPDVARSLRLGDVVWLDGEVVATAGYPTHQRMVAAINTGVPPPVPLDDCALFHLGCMSREEDGVLRPLYVNPTTSTRFNAMIPQIIRHHHITALAGKGGLDAACVAAMREVGCVYFSIVGGAAALVTEGVTEVTETGWDDLILQFRLNRLRLRGFGPLVVAIDAHGNSLFDDLANRAQARLPAILARLAADRAG